MVTITRPKAKKVKQGGKSRTKRRTATRAKGVKKAKSMTVVRL